MLQWTDHGGGKRDEDRDGDSWRVLVTDHGGKRDEGTGMDLGIPGGCCSGQTMVGEREMKEQGWTWGFLEGVVGDRPWWRKER